MKKIKVQQIDLFQGVTRATLEKVFQVGRIERLPKGTVLMRAKEAVGAICFQISGKSIVYNLTHTGKRKILFVCGSGSMLNYNMLDEHKSSVFCETIEESEVLMIPVTEFLKMMEMDFQLVKNIVGAQELKVWRLSHQLKNTNGSIQMERKLVAKLWKLGRDFGMDTEEGIEIDINLSITFLADMLGTSREATSRICATLVEGGLIKINKKRITIINPEMMREFYKTGKISGL